MTDLARASRKPTTAPTRSRKASQEASEGAIDFGPLKDWLGFRLRMAQSASFQAFARQTQQFSVRPGRFALLMLIGRNPGIRQTALSRAIGLDKSTLTPAIADLTRRGFVERRRDAHDKRAAQVFLTPAGETVLVELTRRAARHEQTIERIVGKQNKPQLMAVLRRLATDLG